MLIGLAAKNKINIIPPCCCWLCYQMGMLAMYVFAGMQHPANLAMQYSIIQTVILQKPNC